MMSAWGWAFILVTAAVGMWLGPLALALTYRAVYRRVVPSPAVACIDENFLYGNILRNNWKKIRAEYIESTKEAGLIRSLSSIDPYQKRLTHYGGVTWGVCVLRLYGRQIWSVSERFPFTQELLSYDHRIATAMFSILPPGKQIPAHRGLFKGFLRYHLCISGPNSPRCFLELNGKRYVWREGEDLLFDDTFLHSATNDAATERVVLFLDIVREDVPAAFRKIDRIWYWLAHHSFRARAAFERAAKPIPKVVKTTVDRM